MRDGQIRVGRTYMVRVRPNRKAPRVLKARVIGVTRERGALHWWVKDTGTGRVWRVRDWAFQAEVLQKEVRQ